MIGTLTIPPNPGPPSLVTPKTSSRPTGTHSNRRHAPPKKAISTKTGHGLIKTDLDPRPISTRSRAEQRADSRIHTYKTPAANSTTLLYWAMGWQSVPRPREARRDSSSEALASPPGNRGAPLAPSGREKRQQRTSGRTIAFPPSKEMISRDKHVPTTHKASRIVRVQLKKRQE